MAQSAGLYVASIPLAKEPSGAVKAWRRAQLIDALGLGTTMMLVSLAAVVPGLAIGDPLAGCIVAAAMFYTAYQTFRAAFWELADRALEEEVQLLILRSLADSFDAFDTILAIRTRRSGGVPIIEITLGFQPDREWGAIVAHCAAVRRSVLGNVEGASVSVLPATPELAGLWGERGPAPDSSATVAG